MALIVWSDRLSVGVKFVDDQHTILFNCINDLHDAMMKGQSRAIVGDLLKRLLDYTRKHFSEEEAMLSKSGFPQLAEHKVLHRELTKKVEDYCARHEKADPTVGAQLARFLSDWLNSHIQSTDQNYGRWLKDHNIQVN